MTPPMRALLALCSFPLFVSLPACDRLNVESVRQGTLDFDTSKTLGDIFGTSEVVSGAKWSGFAANDGSQVVQLNGTFTDLQAALDEAFAEIEQNPQAATLVALGSGGEMGALGLAMLVNSPLRIDTCSYQIQFLLSKRDDSFEVGSSVLKAVITNTQTGSSKEHTFGDDDSNVLAAIYENNKSAVAVYVLAQAMQAQVAEGLLRQFQE